MGEIAEMLLDGTLCEGCGVALESEPQGFPNYCSKQCAKDRGADWYDDDDDMGEMWREHKKARSRKKSQNVVDSLAILEENGIDYVCLSEHSRHYRIGNWDFWPSTGKFYNFRTGEKGRGVFNLLEILKQKKVEYKEPTPEQVKAIGRAWLVAGKRPDLHEAAKRKLKKEWRTLYNALEEAFIQK